MIAVGLIVVVGGLGTVAVVKNQGTPKATSQVVAQKTGTETPEEAKVIHTNVSSNVYISGTVEANDSRSVSYMGGGNVDQVYVKVGDVVQPGQVLAKINSDRLDADIKRLKNELSIAQDELNRLKNKNTQNETAAVKTAQLNYDTSKKTYDLNVSLLESGAVTSDEVTRSKQQMDLNAINLESAKRNLQEALKKDDVNIKVKMMESTKISLENNMKDLEKTVIKAPIGGTVTTLSIKAGEVLPANGIILTIDDLNKKLIKAQVAESEINKIQLGQEVVITGNAAKGKKFSGQVTYIAPGTIRTEGSKAVKVEVKIAINDVTPELRPGFNVNLEVKTAAKANALAVPFESINTDEKGNKYVNVIQVSKDNKEDVKRVDVKTGIEGDLYVEVLSGDLKEGDKLQVQY